MITTIKLSKLRLSPHNVRTLPEDQLRIPELVADIASRGVLQNLLVTPAAKPRGTHEVFDGGRRLRALQVLAAEGVIDPAQYDVPVKVLQGDSTVLAETSMAANFQQLKMTPAEECRAFHHFIGATGDIEAVSKRFGLTRRFIEGRLRLAALAEPIFEALANGDITLDLAKAYASTENQEKQLMIWESYGCGYPDTIRRAIASQSMKTTDPVALLVGEDSYIAAGGKVDRDLFSEGGDRWVDPEIAQRLAVEIMELEAQRIGSESGLAWVRPTTSHQAFQAAIGLYPVSLPLPDLTVGQAARLNEIEARHEVLQVEMDREELTEDAFQALDREYDALADEAQAIHRRAPILPDELKPKIGQFLTLSSLGAMCLDTRYYSDHPVRPEDGEDADGVGHGAEVDVGIEGHMDGQVIAAGPAPETIAPDGKPLSAKLFDELAMQRRDIVAACLLEHRGLALDYAVFTMIDERKHCLVHYGNSIRARRPQDPINDDLQLTRAGERLARAHDDLDKSWINHNGEVDRFEAFRALCDDSKASWLAYIVATSLEAKSGYGKKQIPLLNRIATLIQIDVAAWWRPTSENFFDRVTKGAILSLLGDVGGSALTARHAGLKKGEISEACHKLFAGDAIVEPEVKEAALRWVPDAMLFLDVPSSTDMLLQQDECRCEGRAADDDLDREDEPREEDEIDCAEPNMTDENEAIVS